MSSSNRENSVLIIENDHDTRVSLRQVLENEGFYVFSAANGIDGLAVLARIKRPSVILLDQNMPLMSGDEFLTIKNREKDLASIPVIVISAVQNRCTGSTVAFLPKPIDLAGLLRSVRRLCSSQNDPERPADAQESG